MDIERLEQRPSRATVAAKYALSGQGAINVIRTLCALDVLEPAETRTRHGAQVFRAPAVLDVLFS